MKMILLLTFSAIGVSALATDSPEPGPYSRAFKKCGYAMTHDRVERVIACLNAQNEYLNKTSADKVKQPGDVAYNGNTQVNMKVQNCSKVNTTRQGIADCLSETFRLASVEEYHLKMKPLADKLRESAASRGD